jgi:hypothetical protein
MPKVQKNLLKGNSLFYYVPYKQDPFHANQLKADSSSDYPGIWKRIDELFKSPWVESLDLNPDSSSFPPKVVDLMWTFLHTKMNFSEYETKNFYETLCLRLNNSGVDNYDREVLMQMTCLNLSDLFPSLHDAKAETRILNLEQEFAQRFIKITENSPGWDSRCDVHPSICQGDFGWSLQSASKFVFYLANQGFPFEDISNILKFINEEKICEQKMLHILSFHSLTVKTCKSFKNAFRKSQKYAFSANWGFYPNYVPLVVSEKTGKKGQDLYDFLKNLTSFSYKTIIFFMKETELANHQEKFLEALQAHVKIFRKITGKNPDENMFYGFNQDWNSYEILAIFKIFPPNTNWTALAKFINSLPQETFHNRDHFYNLLKEFVNNKK